MCYSTTTNNNNNNDSINHLQRFIQIFIGFIGILSFIGHFIAFILWTTYILGWRIIIKWKSIQRKRQLNYNFMITTPSYTLTKVTTTTTTMTPSTTTLINRNNVNSSRQTQSHTMTKVTATTTTATTPTTTINRNNVNSSKQIQSIIITTTTKETLIWPICSLRLSIQTIILSMEFINIIGCCTDLLRLIYLSITGNDLRLLYGEWQCRLLIFISFISCDISEWHFVYLCIERCYIILYSRKYSHLNDNSMKPTIFIILLIYLISSISNIFLLIPYYSIYNEPFKSKLVYIVKLSITFIIPGLIVIISTVLMIIVLIKWKLKSAKFELINNKHSNHGNHTHHTHHHTSSRITVAKLMLICAILYLFILLCLFVFGSIYDDYCCFLIAKKNCHWIDILFNLLSILYWFILTITSYVLMLGTMTVRHHIQTILLLIWYNIWNRD
uniref:G_PROTEIN_RECEP_F1_2 domain-containing protein n=1 Tax=Schistosoma mansoni TaxID=6183 RepID=A0A5K4FA48_SCHMA